MILGQIRSIRFALLGVALVAMLMANQSTGAAAGVGDAASLSGGGSQRYLVALRGLEMPSLTTAGLSATAAAERDGARVARVDRTVAGLASRLGFRPSFRYRWAFQGFAANLDARQLAAVRADPRVAAVSLDMPVQLTDQSVPTGVQRVHAQPQTSGGPAVPDLAHVNVAEIDTGIRHLTTNPTENELNIGGGVDCADDAQRGSTDPGAWKDADPGGHGSHVAGIIGAKDNGEGVVGVAPGVNLWSVRVFDHLLQGSDATVACGLDWVVSTRSASPPAGTQPIDVANISLRGPRTAGGPENCKNPGADPDIEHAAVCHAFAAGVTMVVAAGNESMDAKDVVPAAYDQVITVAALTDLDGLPGGLGSQACPGPRGPERDDAFARYSNFGPDVDLIAPGSCITSLNRSGTGAGVRELSGTSMAAPHVTGAAARYIARVFNTTGQRPTPGGVRSALRATGGFDWNASTDPDGTPDRLLNVAALSAAPGFDLAVFPSRVTVPAGSGPIERTVQVELVRPGLFAGTIHVTVSAPSGISAVPGAHYLKGIDDTGLSTPIALTVSSGVTDGDYPVAITASRMPGTSDDQHAAVTIHVDRHAPSVADLGAAIIPGTSLGGSVAVHLAWHGQDAGGSLARYELQRQIGAELWQNVSLTTPTSESADRLMELKTDYGFRIRAADDSGNVGDWTAIDRRVGIRESNKNSISYSGSGWTTVMRSSASGGSMRESHTAGAFAGVTFYGTGVAWVAPVGPGKGTATVIVDGHGPGISVDLHAAALGTKRIVFASGAMVPMMHTFTIKVKSGTVDLDAILILG